MFRGARLARKLSQQQLAELTEGPLGPISRTTIGAIEHGRMPSVDALVGLCRCLNLERAIDLARKYDDPAAEALWLVEAGEAALTEGDLEAADRHARAALQIAKPADRVLTVVRGEWIRHQVVKHRSPSDEDRHRVAFLRKLFGRVEGHEGLAFVERIQRELIEPARATEELDHD